MAEHVKSSQEAGEGAAADLGSFDPPREFQFPEALRSPAPRAIPSELKQSSTVRRKRQTIVNVAFVGFACIAASFVPAVALLSQFILPLGYLLYIGGGLLLIALVLAIKHLATAGPLAVVRDGTPGIARVREILVSVGGTKEAPTFKYVIDAEVKDPATGQISRQQIPTGEVGGLGHVQRYSIDLKPGDYTTVVHMPGKQPVVYGTLNIDPAHELILKDGKPPKVMGQVAAVAITAGVVGVMGLLVAMMYGLEFCSPLSGEERPMLIVAGATAALGLIIAIGYWVRKRAQAKVGQAVVLSLLTAFGCGILGAVAAMLLNAKLDRSPSTYREIEVANFWQTTWNLIIRNYDIEYRELASGPNGKTEKFAALPETMDHFDSTRAGVMEIGEGWLGMKWIRALHPVVLSQVADTNREGLVVTMEVTNPDGSTAKEFYITEVKDSNGKPVPMSDALQQRALKSIKGDLPQPGEKSK